LTRRACRRFRGDAGADCDDCDDCDRAIVTGDSVLADRARFVAGAIAGLEGNRKGSFAPGGGNGRGRARRVAFRA
jgi:hypothetical protein